MFRSYIQPSLGPKEISPGIQRVYSMGFHIALQDLLNNVLIKIPNILINILF
jgi:hypothetical protein